MSDIPDDVRKAAGAIVAGQQPLTAEEAAAAGIMAERERIAVWHETQAAALDKALEQILSEGGTIDISRRSLADLHRGFAKAIRGGAF